ncbi:MAG: GGDEF domain-containing protein [Desulfobulbaceae bacterium]|nr:GGDEF domain-containing protein [Desulfobulbaceae bacterium]
MMMGANKYSSPFEESDADRRRGILDDDALSVELVSAFAGDRLLTKSERLRMEELRRSRGLRFFSDLLYSISHQFFSPEVAEDLWTEVLQHKIHLSTVLGRNVRTVVAALDYLSNITGNMHFPTLVGEAVIEEIVGLSLRDGLTGLFNHTYFFQQIDLEVRRAVRYGVDVSLMLIDIDDFKTVNDTYGHQHGDTILAAMGKTLLSVARDSDICCRYGGDEFSVILPLTDVHEAGEIAERIKAEMADYMPAGQKVTVSIGVASFGKTIRTYRDLVERADAALYEVKRNGKNRVEAMADSGWNGGVQLSKNN